eukprot:scaffold5605_cov128-Cylindrotheca_fusiformis.AAC.18
MSESVDTGAGHPPDRPVDLEQASTAAPPYNYVSSDISLISALVTPLEQNTQKDGPAVGDTDGATICGLSKKKFWIIVGCAGLIVVIAIVAAIAVSAGDAQQPPTPISMAPSNSSAPTSAPLGPRMFAMSEILLPGVDLSSMDPSTPQYKALQWIANRDPLELEVVLNAELIERYSLAVFFFSTSGRDSWRLKSRWLTSAHQCNWYRVGCNYRKQVTSISLTSNGLRGEIPTELGNLLSLDSMELNFNKLNGTIPSELSRLEQLTNLYIVANSLTGTIPSEFGNLTNLNELWLGTNSLMSTIPSELGSLSALQVLVLYENKLTGSLPSQLGGLAQLTEIGISDNLLSGSIPSELNQLSNIKGAFFYNNDFDGGLDTLLCEWNVDNFYADCLGTPPEIVCGCCIFSFPSALL